MDLTSLGDCHLAPTAYGFLFYGQIWRRGHKSGFEGICLSYRKEQGSYGEEEGRRLGRRGECDGGLGERKREAGKKKAWVERF